MAQLQTYTYPSSEEAKKDEEAEILEWTEALDRILQDRDGFERSAHILEVLGKHAYERGVSAARAINTAYVNTIPVAREEPYPGNRQLERRIESWIRWNALAMVHHQNKKDAGIGGHISTYSSLATLVEVGFNHFFHAAYGNQAGDFVYIQGHASPGIYARAFLEGRLSREHLENFRHELRSSPGLSSYPHPWLMPNFWQFPTVSMGLAPIHAIYQARFMRYLENRNLVPKTPRRVWAFVGDGEMEEPESTGSLTLAARAQLDNLIFVVNCNLQRLDGLVRGNGKIIQELEAIFRGAGWNVIKVLWGGEWDPLLAKDRSGLLRKRMEECVDGEYQNYKVKGGAYIREQFFGKYPELRELVANLSDAELGRLRYGGHDTQKVYNAYKHALEHKGGPTVILAKTVKGYGIGSAEARNATHQEKKLSTQDLQVFRSRFDIPITEEAAEKGAFYRPPEDCTEIAYLKERRQQLGGYIPQRALRSFQFETPSLDYFAEFLEDSKQRPVSTTMGFVSILRHLLKEPRIGQYVVPIVPDEARTFGMESLIRQVGIFASQGQLYKPYDRSMFLYYREEKDGQMLEEGITEAGSMGSCTAAGTAYCNYGIPMIPFFAFYSMFGFQRIGDLIWAFGDARGKGFLMGGTAGRTTLAGEGLQHQDGHSLLLATSVPTCASYDPAYVYEIAVIIQDGIHRMYEKKEDRFYYITMYNENYPMPAMPEGSHEGILRGIYKLRTAKNGKAIVQLLGSGPIVNEALRAQRILDENYHLPADVWSVTSYCELRRDADEAERWNRLHPGRPRKRPYILSALNDAEGPIVAATDYVKLVPDQVARWLGDRLVVLGTDGFGRSDNREHLRRHFEVNAESIAGAALSCLESRGQLEAAQLRRAFKELNIKAEKPNPLLA